MTLQMLLLHLHTRQLVYLYLQLEKHLQIQGNWIITSAVTGERVTNFSVSGTGTQSATISTTTNHANGGLDSGAKHNIFARINKGNATRRTKTLTETTITGTIDSDGENLRFVKIPYADIYEVISIKQTDSEWCGFISQLYFR